MHHHPAFTLNFENCRPRDQRGLRCHSHFTGVNTEAGREKVHWAKPPDKCVARLEPISTSHHPRLPQVYMSQRTHQAVAGADGRQATLELGVLHLAKQVAGGGVGPGVRATQAAAPRHLAHKAGRQQVLIGGQVEAQLAPAVLQLVEGDVRGAGTSRLRSARGRSSQDRKDPPASTRTWCTISGAARPSVTRPAGREPQRP